MSALPEIRNQTKAQIQDWMLQNGEKPFRGKQVYEWLWKHNVSSFEAMENLSKSLREKLVLHFGLGKVEIESRQISKDGTIKYIFKLPDGNLVEGVLIPTENRVTACISSQVGCSLSCSFCATGFLDLKRNIQHFEIYDQIDLIRKEAEEKMGRPLTNIVYMGMGEPLLNYKNVMQSIEMVTSEDGMGMSPRRITVSTAGIAKMIKKLGDDGAKFEFALSLHAANDEMRNKIMPINESNSLAVLEEALTYFYEKTGTRSTLEYIIFKDFNDREQDALDLLAFARRLVVKINIIEYNPISEAGFKNTTRERMDRFVEILEKGGLIVNVRRSRGRDVDGACGQLALKKKENVFR